MTFTANKDFDSAKPINLQFDDLHASPSFLSQGDGTPRWQVTLCIQHQPARIDANTPYYFTVDMVGFFSVAESYPAEQAEWLVKTNATSVLFSAAREIIRAITAQGPYGAMILPTASFYDAKALEAAPAASVGQLSGKS